MRIVIPVLALATLSACGGGQPPRTPPAMVPAGDPVNCIQTREIRSTLVRDEQTIDFRMSHGEVFRNTLPNRCPGLGFSRAFGYSPTASQLCSVDVITVLNQGAGSPRGASCGLGAFVPVKPAEGG
jgi:hypothetical protein